MPDYTSAHDGADIDAAVTDVEDLQSTGLSGINIDGGTIDGTTIGGNSAAAVSSSSGALNGTLGATTPATASVTTLNASGLVTVNSTQSANQLTIAATHATYASQGILLKMTRAATGSFSFFEAFSSVLSDKEFSLQGQGDGTCDGSWTGGGADYAEWFEWADGNPNDEDRVGYPVTLVGNKIKLAVEGDTLIGAISGQPAMVGDGDIDRWKGKYLKDDFGRYIFEEYYQVEWVEILVEAVEGVEADEENDIEGVEAKKAITEPHTYQHDQIPEGVTVPDDAITTSQDEDGNNLQRRKLNPEWTDAPYIPRADRKEWSTVGLMGKLRIRVGQPVAANWVKMRDVSDSVEEWLIK